MRRINRGYLTQIFGVNQNVNRRECILIFVRARRENNFITAQRKKKSMYYPVSTLK